MAPFCRRMAGQEISTADSVFHGATVPIDGGISITKTGQPAPARFTHFERMIWYRLPIAVNRALSLRDAVQAGSSMMSRVSEPPAFTGRDYRSNYLRRRLTMQNHDPRGSRSEEK